MSLIKRQKVENGVGEVVRNGKVLYSEAVSLEGHKGAIYSCRFNDAGNLIASGGDDKTINIWKLPVNESDDSINMGSLNAHKGAITSLRWLKKSSDTIVSGSADNCITFWDLTTGKKIRNFKSTNIINEIDVCDDYVMSVDDDGKVCLWDQRQKLPITTIKNKYPIISGCSSNQGDYIYFGGIEPKITAFDIKKLFDDPVWTSSASIESITSISINNDDSQLVSRSTSGNLSIYNAKKFVPQGISRSSPYVYEGALSYNDYKPIKAGFSNDGVSLISGSDDKSVNMWDITSRKLLNKFPGHQSSVLDVCYHPSENIILSSSLDGSIIVREI